MKKIAIIAALVATVAAPAFAQSARVSAVQHFNMFADNVAELIARNNGGTPTSDAGTTGTELRILHGSKDAAAERDGANEDA